MIDQTFPVGTAARVEVKTQSGEIRFVPGNAGELRVVADSSPHAPLDVYQRGETVVVATNKTGWMRNDNADVTVYAPPGTEATVNTASADVRATTPLSLLEVNVASGDVNFESVNELRIRTASGDVRGALTEGPMDVVSASGDVSVGTCRAKANVSSASGDVEIGTADGPITVSTASGEVRIDRCNAEDVNCKSMSGSVRLGVPERTRVSLDAKTLSGQVKIPRGSGDGAPDRNLSIRIRSVSGDLQLKRVSRN